MTDLPYGDTFGGGILFRSLLDAGLVDTIELSVVPIMLSQGIPLIARGERSRALRLTSSKQLPTGTLLLKYAL
jgi:dihydrofolate reductase